MIIILVLGAMLWTPTARAEEARELEARIQIQQEQLSQWQQMICMDLLSELSEFASGERGESSKKSFL